MAHINKNMVIDGTISQFIDIYGAELRENSKRYISLSFRDDIYRIFYSDKDNLGFYAHIASSITFPLGDAKVSLVHGTRIGNIPTEETHDWILGDCYAFAIAIARITGLKCIMAHGVSPRRNRENGKNNRTILHAWVDGGNGDEGLDCLGIRKKDDIILDLFGPGVYDIHMDRQGAEEVYRRCENIRGKKHLDNQIVLAEKYYEKYLRDNHRLDLSV